MPSALAERYIDSDGHILEHPTEMLEYAPAAYRDRIWHIETDSSGAEWLVFNGDRRPANPYALSGTAGMSSEDRERAHRGELRYTEVRPAAYNAKARLRDMDEDGIDMSVLYPTRLLGIQGELDVEFASIQCQVYNQWISDHTSEGENRLFGAGALPPMHHPDDVKGIAAEIGRIAELPGLVSAFMRPNPSIDWRPFNDPVYDPIWAAAQDADLPIALHPLLFPDLPGACTGLRLARPRNEDGSYVDNFDPLADIGNDRRQERGKFSIIFTQSIANPVDVMAALCFLTTGGVCERFPRLKLVFLEANGGWLVPWLERLDHHVQKFHWEVPELSLLPSEYFKRQCWISFDPDETMLGVTARSPLVGADRIIWASDYPHPDAKFPGVTLELSEALDGLDKKQKQSIMSGSAMDLYGIG